MEYQFENVGTPNVRVVAEMRYRINAKRIWIPVGIYLLLTAYLFWQYLHGYAYLFIPVAFLAFTVYLALMPYLQIRKSYKKEIKFYYGKLPENTARFGEIIRVENTTASRNWEYDHIVKIFSCKYSYCLHFADKSVVLVYRENFTKGTFEEFKQFLRQKRPDLKIPE